MLAPAKHATGAAAATATAAGAGDGGKRTTELVGRFLREQLAHHRQAWQRDAVGGSSAAPPLFVAVQGPQGCGKSHLTSQLPAHMSPHGIKTAVLSLDDLYLPHSGLVSLAAAHPDNVLLRGRGQPGTHDISLGLRCMEALKRINDGEGSRVEMPIFDKSRFGGEGDRSEAVVQVTAGVDIVVLEGWMMGFAPLEEDELRSKYAAAASASRPEGADPPFFLAHALDHLEWSSMALREYGPLWTYFDCFVQMKPVEIGYTWQWRLQQEHNMKAANGGIGMSDEQIKAFIARYMPGYELYLESVQRHGAPWEGRGLRLVIGREREVIADERF